MYRYNVEMSWGRDRFSVEVPASSPEMAARVARFALARSQPFRDLTIIKPLSVTPTRPV